MLNYPAKAKRRRPTQERSIATVDAIVTAAARLYEAGGVEAATAERIAEKAGVGIGSLYEYFPTREAVLLELSERYTREENAAMREQAARFMEMPFADVIRQMLVTHIAGMKKHLPLRRVVLASIPRATREQTGDDLEPGFVDMLSAFLTMRAGETRAERPGLTARLMVAAIDGISETLMTAAPDLIDSPEVLEELVLLCTGYLGASPESSKKR